MFTAALFTEATSVQGQINGDKVVNIYDGILLGHKNEWNLSICNNMVYLEGTVLSATSQIENVKYHVHSLTCGIWNTR